MFVNCETGRQPVWNPRSQMVDPGIQTSINIVYKRSISCYVPNFLSGFTLTVFNYYRKV